MAKPRKDQDMEEARRIMERLVNTPHKPHADSKIGKVVLPPKKNLPTTNKKGTG